MACRTMPFYEIQKGIYEIDEFDCTEVFVIIGEKRALVIDTGTGIGDLKGMIAERITQLPYDVVATHNHGDHIGGAGWFDRIYIHQNDMTITDPSVAPTLEFRKKYAKLIRDRENKYYNYDPEKDIMPWPKEPEWVAIEDGYRFDLGGRTVTAFHCPGHTPGEIVLLDDKTRTLLCGDAFNCNWLLNTSMGETLQECAEKALAAMERIYDMRDSYDRVYNSHHDFRGFGSPLSPDVIPNLITCLQQILDGTVRYEEAPDALNPGKTHKIARFQNVFISCLTSPSSSAH